MALLPEPHLERATARLRTVVEQNAGFLSDLANITLTLLASARTDALPSTTKSRLTTPLVEAVRDLALAELPAEALRGRVFWTFFHAAALRLAVAYFDQTFSHPDVALLRFLSERRLDFEASEELPRANYLVATLPRELLSDHFAELLAKTRSEFAAGNSKLEGENNRAEISLQKLEEFHQRAEQLERVLGEQTKKLNFVGLSRAFEQMIGTTREDLRTPVKGLGLLGTMLFLVPIVAMYLLSTGSIEPWWKISGPLLAVEVVLFYFFRVLLGRYQALRAQELQLELRYSLCAFVEGYSEFAARLRKTAGADNILDRFEGLVFSSISPDPQKIPSQFDGLESIASIARAWRGKE